MPAYFALDEGLRAFILAFIDEEAVPADENHLASRLSGSGQRVALKDIQMIVNFAIGCGYVEKLGSRLVFTRLARDKATIYKRSNAAVAKLPPAPHSGFIPTGA
jgi:hypothetical protein